MNKREKAEKILKEKGIHFFIEQRLVFSCHLDEDELAQMPKTFKQSEYNSDQIGSFTYKGNKYLFKKMSIGGEKDWDGIFPGDWCFYFNDELVLMTEIDWVKGKGEVVSEHYEIMKLYDWVDDLPEIMQKILDVKEESYQKCIKEEEDRNIDLGRYDDK